MLTRESQRKKSQGLRLIYEIIHALLEERDIHPLTNIADILYCEEWVRQSVSEDGVVKEKIKFADAYILHIRERFESRGHVKWLEVAWHTIDVISTVYLQRRHMAPIYGRMIILWSSSKNIKAKSNRTVRMRL